MESSLPPADPADYPWGVMGDGGFGYGYFKTREEAEERRDGLLRMRGGEGQFVVVKVHL